MKVQCLGLCRFSYPSDSGAFQRGPNDAGNRGAFLYDPIRMATRFFFFEQLVLPTLRQQTNKDFTILLLFGDDMPAQMRQHLVQLVADVPQVRLCPEPPGQKHNDICRRVMLEARDPDADWVAEFRIDDDDGLALGFIQQCHDLAPILGALAAQSSEKRAVLDFSKGYVLDAARRGLDIQPVLARLWTPGLVTYNRPDHPKSLLDSKHLKLWHKLPVLGLAEDPMFIRGAHAGNDSAIQTRKIQKFRIDPFDIPGQIEDHFGLELEQVEMAWLDCPGRKS